MAFQAADPGQEQGLVRLGCYAIREQLVEDVFAKAPSRGSLLYAS